MKFCHHNHSASFNLLLQVTVLLAGMKVCYSVTYFPSTDACKGNQVKSKCDSSGRRAARVNDSNSLNMVTKVINMDGEKYWSGLSWHKSHGYCWESKPSQCGVQVQENILDRTEVPDQGMGGWYCFAVIDGQPYKLKAFKCSKDNLKYICELDIPSELASTPSTTSIPAPLATTMLTATASTTTSKLTSSDRAEVKDAVTLLSFEMSSAVARTFYPLKPITSIMKKTLTTTLLQPSQSIMTVTSTSPPTTTLQPTAVKTIAASSPGLVITPSSKSSLSAGTVIPSNIHTTKMTNVKESLVLSTAKVVSSIVETKRKNGSTQERQSAAEKLHHYIEELKALNATKKDSLKKAISKTSELLEDLKSDLADKNGINLLVATQKLEAFALKYGKVHLNENETQVISQAHYALKIQNVSAGVEEATVYSLNRTLYPAMEGRASVNLPPSTFKGKGAVVVFIVYNDIKRLVPDGKHAKLDGKTFKNLKLGSRVIAASVDPKPTGFLEDHVTISFSYDNETKREDIPHCFFWDFTIRSELDGSWSNEGCSLLKENINEVTCSCNHLTNFAVLMQVKENRLISSEHLMALEGITYVGCALSLAGEVLTIIAYCVLMNLKQEKFQIRLNLVVAIAIAQIAFLTGIDIAEPKGVCVLVAALIHFFYLAGFAWMLFEGVYLYLMVVKVFNTVVRMRVFYAVAWGFPALIVVVSLLAAAGKEGDINSYVHGDFCWVSFTNNLIWTFVSPVLVVCLINTVLLGLLIHEITRMKSNNTSELEKLKQGAKACAVLFPLLGMTWVFGVLSVTNAGLVFQYIFTILNSLQGFFIFVLHVNRNSDVRAEFQRKKQKWKDMKIITSSQATQKHASHMWTNKVTSDDALELRRSDSNEATSRPSSGYDNSVFFYHQRSMTTVDT